ncbi:MAG: type 4 pilus major pilin [Gammaproteobacteria bacterium]
MLRAFKKRQAGVTLFEVLLVLFVAAFIAAAVGTIYAKVTMTFKQNQLQNGLQQLTANITATYSGSGYSNYSDIDVKKLIAAGLVPDDMHNSETAINPWEQTDGWSFATGNPVSTYVLTVISIPKAACSAMYQGLSKISTAKAMEINKVEVSSPATAVAECSKSDANEIKLYVN